MALTNHMLPEALTFLVILILFGKKQNISAALICLFSAFPGSLHSECCGILYYQLVPEIQLYKIFSE
jgi:hypothetical protein